MSLINPGRIQRFVVPSAVLRRHPEEAVALVRLGALANAILSATGMMVSSAARGVGQQRDILQATLLITSYFKEAVDVINNKHSWLLVEAAVADGYKLPIPLVELKKLFSRDKDSPYKRGAFHVRRTKGFHVDADHFHQWLTQLRAPFVTLWRKESTTKIDRAFTASAQIQSFFGHSPDQDTGMAIVKGANYLVHVVEAMSVGLLLKAGLDARDAWRPMIPRQIRLEYSFNDGRQPLCDWCILPVDTIGDLNGVVHELTDHVSVVLGGRRAGASEPGQDSDISFSSDRGAARGWLGPVIQQELPDDPRDVAFRLHGMARWGSFLTKQALGFADAVRTGTITREQTLRFIDELSNSVTYWEEREVDTDRWYESYRTEQ